MSVKEGDRITLAEYVDRFPFFLVEPGATGTVTEASDKLITVKMDAHIDGCEEWDNEIIFNLPDDGEEAAVALQVVS